MTLYFLPAEAYIKFHRHNWRPRLDLWGGMLKIGLPAGAEFALMAVYLVLVYSVSRPFGASAQAGFGIGLRVVQACFLPVVALGFAVSPGGRTELWRPEGGPRQGNLPHSGSDRRDGNARPGGCGVALRRWHGQNLLK
jgi:hypothetical protein